MRLANLIRYRPRPSAFLGLGLAGLLIYLLIAIFGSTGMQRVRQLEAELAGARAENERLAGRNRALEEEIVRLADDPQHRESMARYHFGLIGPDEIFIQEAE
ncbi:MAG: septum formation initiator family protein [Betaproteobacteria bacterium]|nr:septum formation initiator family protein [Betaproteobacteria bacterium]